MNETDARDYIRTRFGVSRETLCEKFVGLVLNESANQSLIAPKTWPTIWSRHIADSAQLLDLAGQLSGTWHDIGSGAGFPGVIIAALSDAHVTLIEPRRKRAEFLDRATRELGLEIRTTVAQSRVETLAGPAGVISARAVAALHRIFAMAHHLSTPSTTWIMPRGASAHRELENAREFWHGKFHVEQSITSPDAWIVVAQDIRQV